MCLYTYHAHKTIQKQPDISNSENLKFQKPTSFSGNHGHGRLLGISSLLSARFSALTLRALGRGSKCSAGPGGWTTWPGDCMEQLLGLVCYSGCCVWLVVATCTREICEMRKSRVW